MAFKFHHQSISLDEVSIIPKSVTTYSDDDVDLSVDIGNLKLKIPIIGAAMDSVSSPDVLARLHSQGSFGVVNLCGLISRYKLSDYAKIDVKLRNNETVGILQDIYNSVPVDISILRENLQRLSEMVGNSGWFAVSATPQQAERLFDVALSCGVRNFVIQSSFISPYWSSEKSKGLNIGEFIKYLHQAGCTVMVGNVASLSAAVPFIEAGVDAIIEGIGPGVQCTTRFVLGIGAGHVTTISDLREYIENQKSKTKIIADGGIHNSGDIIKLICCGAHAVIIGGMLARTVDAPFVGYHWGMSSFHRVLPRGTLLKFDVDEKVNVDRLLFGPSFRSDGTLALIPALTNAFSNLGCTDINSAYRDTLVTRFAGLKTEGKGKL